MRSNSARSVMKTRTITTSANVRPSSASTATSSSMQVRVSVSMSPGPGPPGRSAAIWPETYTRSPSTTAWEYVPPWSEAALFTWRIGGLSLAERDARERQRPAHDGERRRRLAEQHRRQHDGERRHEVQ